VFEHRYLEKQAFYVVFFFSSRRRHTRFSRDWSSDVCSSDLWRPATGAWMRCWRNLAELHRLRNGPALFSSSRIGLHELELVGDVETDNTFAFEMNSEALRELVAMSFFHNEYDVGPFELLRRKLL